MAESAPSPAPAIDWADDTDDEIDFGAPVFSDDDELAPELAKIRADRNYGASKPASPPTATATSSSYSSSSGQYRDSSSPRYTAGFNDGSNRSLDRRSHNDSSLQTMSSRSSRGRDYPPSYRDSPDSHHHSSFSSPRGSTPVDRDSKDRLNKSSLGHPPPRRDRDFGGDGRGHSFGSPQSDSSARWGSRNNDDQRGSTGQPRPARQVIPLPPKPSVTPDRPHMDRSRSPSYRSRSPLPGISTDRLRDRPTKTSNHSQQQQRTQSPHLDQGRSLSPSSAHHSNNSNQGGRSFSPGRQHQPRTHMDQVIRASEQSKRRSRDSPASDGGGRWEKTPHEDKPYPTLPQPPSAPSPAHVASHSPKEKDDTVYFLRREGRNNNNGNSDNVQQSEPIWTSDLRKEGRNSNSSSGNNNNVQQSEAIWTSDLRKNAGTMYHEREKPTVHNNSNNNSRNHNSNGSNDRWGKASLQEPDLPYPERSSPSQHRNNNGGQAKHSRTQSRGQRDNFPVTPSPPVEKTFARGTRGKGKEQKHRSKDQALNDDTQADKDGGSEVPWWEQSTYGAKKKEGPTAAAPEETPKPAVASKETLKPAVTPTEAHTPTAAPKETPQPEAPKETPKPATPKPAAKSSAKSTTTPAPEPKGDKPWWEQSTYNVKPKTTTTTTTTDTATTMKTTTQAGGGQTTADTMARRKALSETKLASGVEALTLVSRGDDDSTGSSHSIKNRSVQELIFAEIKAMIVSYEDKYGSNKMRPIPPRSRQSEEMDTILESFRKLREGLFATQARDLFSVEVYEQSVLNSLYAGNIPELTKALHHLVQELHPVVYTLSPPSHSSPSPSANDNDNYSKTLTSFAQIPARRQTFLGLYILHHIARPPRHNSISVALTEDPLFQTVNHPKTGTDELVASFLYLFPLHSSSRSQQNENKLVGLNADLRLALQYWTYLRQGNWIGRERLLGTDRTLASGLPITWEQRLMIRYSMGDSLGTARSLSVATMQKAYYSLPVSVAAQAADLRV
ncbi:hypothetical protein BGZ96_005938 [Linnemannia gamsii]|uniref:Uncharacterized protein n=1 Tax=Linnemannia gamsii TaxID=64522 RepID=A0ABQ7K4L5_9FUNG|nr:hypothetical protein BGZ96_005938 [Linnemannia gamsii]